MSDTQRAKLPAKNRLPKKKCLLVLAATVLLLGLIAGGVVLFWPQETVFSVGTAKLDAGMYNFWFASLKTDYMEAYGIDGNRDNAAFWASVCTESDANGATWGEYLTAKIDAEIKAKTAAAAVFDQTGKTPTSARIASIDDYIGNEIDMAAGGDEEAFDALLATYHTDRASLEKCALYEIKAELLYRYLYATDVPAADKETFYRALYSRVKVVRFDKSQPALKQGSVAAAEAALDGALGGNGAVDEATFDGYVQLSDDDTHIDGRCPNGLYLYSGFSLKDEGGQNSPYPEAVENALFSVKAGELIRVETADAVWYARGYELDEGAYDRSENEVFFTDFYVEAGRWSFNKRLAAETEKVAVNEEKYAALPGITGTPYCYVITRYHFD